MAKETSAASVRWECPRLSAVGMPSISRWGNATARFSISESYKPKEMHEATFRLVRFVNARSGMIAVSGTYWTASSSRFAWKYLIWSQESLECEHRLLRAKVSSGMCMGEGREVRLMMIDVRFSKSMSPKRG